MYQYKNLNNLNYNCTFYLTKMKFQRKSNQTSPKSPQRTAKQNIVEQIKVNILQAAKAVVRLEFQRNLKEFQFAIDSMKPRLQFLQKQSEKWLEINKERTSLEEQRNQITQRQNGLTHRQEQLKRRLQTESKEQEILKLMVKIKQEAHNIQLTAQFQNEKLKLTNDAQRLKGQLQIKDKDLIFRQAGIKQLKAEKEKLNNEYTDLKDKYDNLYQRFKSMELERQKEKANMMKRYESHKEQKDKAYQEQYKAKIQQKQYEAKDIMWQLQEERSLLNGKVHSQSAKIEHLQNQISSFVQFIQELKLKSTKIDQQNQGLTKMLKQLQKQYQNEFQHNVIELQAQFSKQLSQIHSSVQNRIAQQCKKIKQDQQRLFQQSKKRSAASAQKEKDALLKQIQDLRKEANQSKRLMKQKESDFQKVKEEIQDIANKKINELKAILLNISNIILEKSYKVVQNQKIIQIIITKMNDLKAQQEMSLQNQVELKQKNQNLQSYLRQVRKWFDYMINIINVEQIVDALNQNKQNIINDADIRNAVSTFTKKLQARFSKFKRQEVANIKEIEQLKEASKITNDRQIQIQGKLGQAIAQKERTSAQKQSIQAKLSSQNRQLKIQIQKAKSIEKSMQIEIKNLQNIRIPELIKKIEQLTSKNATQSAEMKNIQRKYANLSDQKQGLKKTLTSKQLQGGQSLKRLDEIKQQMKAKEKQWNSTKEIQLNKLRAIVNELFDTPVVDNTFESLLQYIRNKKKSGSEIVPLMVSPIFENAPKEREVLTGLLCNFLQCKSIKSTFLYKYDEFNKNFSNYLPIKQSYDFIIIARSKKSQIFGVASCGLGAKSKAMAFNLNSGKSFTGDPNVNSSTFDGGYLIFGQGQIRFRSNSNLEMVVTTRIFSTRYFSFIKEQLVGVENGDSVLLDAIEVHRINH